MQAASFTSADRATRRRELGPMLGALFHGEPDLVANLANAAALLREALPQASWAGFYLLKDGGLVLGPFQGKVACVRIALGRGVCGTAAAERRTLLVPDVEAFPGHIACDAGSRSEIVVPILAGGRVLGVIDVDSYEPAAFDEEDARALEVVAVQLAALAWP